MAEHLVEQISDFDLPVLIYSTDKDDDSSEISVNTDLVRCAMQLILPYKLAHSSEFLSENLRALVKEHIDKVKEVVREHLDQKTDASLIEQLRADTFFSPFLREVILERFSSHKLVSLEKDPSINVPCYFKQHPTLFPWVMSSELSLLALPKLAAYKQWDELPQEEPPSSIRYSQSDLYAKFWLKFISFYNEEHQVKVLRNVESELENNDTYVENDIVHRAKIHRIIAKMLSCIRDKTLIQETSAELFRKGQPPVVWQNEALPSFDNASSEDDNQEFESIYSSDSLDPIKSTADQLLHSDTKRLKDCSEEMLLLQLGLFPEGCSLYEIDFPFVANKSLRSRSVLNSSLWLQLLKKVCQPCVYSIEKPEFGAEFNVLWRIGADMTGENTLPEVLDSFVLALKREMEYFNEGKYANVDEQVKLLGNDDSNLINCFMPLAMTIFCIVNRVGMQNRVLRYLSAIKNLLFKPNVSLNLEGDPTQKIKLNKLPSVNNLSPQESALWLKVLEDKELNVKGAAAYTSDFNLIFEYLQRATNYSAALYDTIPLAGEHELPRILEPLLDAMSAAVFYSIEVVKTSIFYPQSKVKSEKSLASVNLPLERVLSALHLILKSGQMLSPFSGFGVAQVGSDTFVEKMRSACNLMARLEVLYRKQVADFTQACKQEGLTCKVKLQSFGALDVLKWMIYEIFLVTGNSFTHLSYNLQIESNFDYFKHRQELYIKQDPVEFLDDPYTVRHWMHVSVGLPYVNLASIEASYAQYTCDSKHRTLRFSPQCKQAFYGDEIYWVYTNQSVREGSAIVTFNPSTLKKVLLLSSNDLEAFKDVLVGGEFEFDTMSVDLAESPKLERLLRSIFDEFSYKAQVCEKTEQRWLSQPRKIAHPFNMCFKEDMSQLCFGLYTAKICIDEYCCVPMVRDYLEPNYEVTVLFIPPVVLDETMWQLCFDALQKNFDMVCPLFQNGRFIKLITDENVNLHYLTRVAPDWDKSWEFPRLGESVDYHAACLEYWISKKPLQFKFRDLSFTFYVKPSILDGDLKFGLDREGNFVMQGAFSMFTENYEGRLRYALNHFHEPLLEKRNNYLLSNQRERISKMQKELERLQALMESFKSMPYLEVAELAGQILMFPEELLFLQGKLKQVEDLLQENVNNKYVIRHPLDIKAGVDGESCFDRWWRVRIEGRLKFLSKIMSYLEDSDKAISRGEALLKSMSESAEFISSL